MNSNFLTYLTVSEAMMLLLLLSSNREVEAKESSSSQANNNNQPLAGLDRVLRQVSAVRLDTLMDPKMTTNMTNTLNEMAGNLRKMFMENRRLASQIQEVTQRMQNATGVNATSTINNLQSQAANMSNLNVNNLVSRFQNPQ